jgi:cell division septation protein DedD
MPVKSNQVKIARRILFLGGILLGGCSTAHDVAVSSFRVLDAPANFVRRKIDEPGSTVTSTTTTTTTAASDISTPGRHVVPSNRGPQNRQVTTPSQPGPTAPPRITRNTTTEKPKPSPSAAPRNVVNPPAQTQYPTAKVVPGKPGYVFSPYDPSGGYVDVNGYTSGSKVKDPYSGKIFLVP